MANDFHHTLSPESIFVKSDPPPKTLSMRIEEFYLGLLRLFILIVLAASLIGAMSFGYQALRASSEQALPYIRPSQSLPEERFLAQIRKDGVDGVNASSPVAGGSQKPGDAKGAAFEDQLNRQVGIANDFLAPLARSISNSAAFKDRQRMLADELAGAGAVTDPLAYARRQTDFLERVLKDKLTLEQVRQKAEQNPAYPDEFMSKVLDYYPNAVRNEHKAKMAFERDEGVRVANVRANSMLQFYTAGGLFVVFLVICLILVLLKIERNLRTRGDTIQIVS